jgi:hypothetical protein
LAILVAVVIATTPVINVLCAMDCSHTRHTRTATAHCHDAARDEGVTLRSVPAPCHHDCTSSIGALVTSVSGRSVADPEAGASIIVQPIQRVLRPLCQMSNGLPGPVGHRTLPLLAVLRI